ncbi:hypothetical protein [Saccharolobus sp. A20]|uniref:hypothetical protein n=1 Tax=Saccharolobus sp. A20 TaxID=1891280 RepID=UPI0012EA29E2|nr:hypothetical protein [Sulfolobus sp. A20]
MNKTLLIIGVVLIVLAIVIFFISSYLTASSISHSFHFTTIYLTPGETYNITIDKTSILFYNTTLPVAFYGSSLTILTRSSENGCNTLVLEPTSTPAVFYIHNNNQACVDNNFIQPHIPPYANRFRVNCIEEYF